ncbi:MAG: single-stranded DNA-binding protein [Aeromicrobium sp.]
MTNETNHVAVVGRISQPIEVRTLPSGDELATFRIIVPRSAAALKRSKQKVDTFECVVWTAKLRKAVARFDAGDSVAVTGELRRRFSRAQGSPASFVSIEVVAVHKVVAAA